VPAKHFGDEVHTDVWGLSSIPTRQGHQYFASFTDDCTHFTVIFLIQTKDEAFAAYKTFEALVLTQQHCKGIKVLRSDRGGKYLCHRRDDEPLDLERLILLSRMPLRRRESS
jgi:hypothetical protein